jgi:3-methylfumaryl-CoA hydratase
MTSMDMSMNMDIAHLRQWIGRTEETGDLVTPRLVRGLLATLDRDDGAVPTAIHWCLAPAMARQSRLGPDGHAARGEFLPPVSLPRRMWAGGALEFFDALRVGDQVTRRSRIADVQAKDGRSGALCFVTVEHDYATARGRAIRERQDIVYRAAETAPGNERAPEPPRPEARWRRALTADATVLFRYSALTFNGHRIHYDRTYCREVEHYPGLVVHGPLQATLLIEHAAATRGRAPLRFDFRAVRPLFDGTEFSVNAAEDGDALSLWIADRDGRATMTATARWEKP